MSDQLQNEFLLNSNASISLNDGIKLIHHEISQNSSNIAAQVSLASNETHSHVNNLNFNITNQQSAAFSSADFNRIEQDQNMSQTAQIVLLPTQNINMANSSKSDQVQMILPNDIGYQIIPNVSVLVPTTILITDKNECILIPQNSQNMCQPLPLASTDTQANESVDSTSDNSLYMKRWVETERPEQQIITKMDLTENLRLAREQDCEYITLTNTGTQTFMGGLPHSDINPTAQLIGNNCQILGIIGSNQIGILQNEATTDNQVLLAACIENEESQIQSSSNYDINAFLASTISTMPVEKSDQNQAKQWLKDSFIVNRALKALKKSNARSHHSNRPHANWR